MAAKGRQASAVTAGRFLPAVTVALLAFVLLPALGWYPGATADAAPPSVAFGAPRLIDALPPFPGALINGISCGSETRCVAVGEQFATSTSNAGGPGAPDWSHSQLISEMLINRGGVSCAADGGCVAIAASNGEPSRAVVSADYGETWSEPITVPTASPGAFLTSISCARVGSRDVCAAGDNKGGVSVSVDGGRTWATRAIAGSTNGIYSMSCSEAGVCVGVTGGFTVVATRFAVESNPPWKLSAAIASSSTVISSSCVSGGKCVAVTNTGGVYSSSDLAAAGAIWTASFEGAPSQFFESVSCDEGQAFPAGFCVAVDRAGEAVISTEPWETGASWSVVPTGDSSPWLTSVYCMASGWCTAGDTEGGEIHATIDAADPSLTAWSTRIVINGVNQLSGVSCIAGGRCATVDTTGHALISEDNGGSWSGSTVDLAGNRLGPVACAGDGGCVAVQGENAYVAADGSASWSKDSGVDPGHVLTGISCAQTTCMAIDATGDAVVAADPGGSPRWSAPSSVGDSANLTGVSCPSDELCVAVDAQGGFTFTDPTAVAPKWSEPRTVDERVGGGGSVTPVRLQAISCPSTELCVAVDSLGGVIHTVQPAVRRAWSAPVEVTGGTSSLIGVSCPGAGLCVVLGARGDAWYTTDPSAPLPTWNAASGNAAMRALSCAPGGFCVGVDGAGRAQAATLGVLSPSSTAMEFPETHVGAAVEQTLTVEDTGLGNLQVSKVEPVSDETGAYSVVADGCLGATLPPGGRCDIRLAFRPSAVGGASALLLIEGADPSGPRLIGLTGVGSPATTASPPAQARQPKGTKPPAPSRFRVLSAKAGAHGSIALRLALPAAGKVTIKATGPSGSAYAPSVSRVVGEGKTISVKLTPKGGVRAALKRAGKLSVRLAAKFAPRHGAVASKSTTVTVRER